MKKIIYFSILIFMFIPEIILADSAGPTIIGYDAIVINKKGAKAINDENNTVVKYNTKIYVYAEYDNEVSACLDKKSQYDCGNSVTLKISDIAPAKSEVTPKDFKTSEKDEIYIDTSEIKFLISNKKGAKLKKGPADAYGTYNRNIPYKTILKSNNFVHAYSIHDMPYYPFIYVDVDGYKGWVDATDVAIYYDDEIMAFKDSKLYDDDNKIVATIPSETVIKGYYGYVDSGIFIEYNGELRYSKELDYGYKSSKGNLLTLKKVSIKSIEGDVRGEIPLGEKVKILYGNDSSEYDEVQYHYTYPIKVDNKDYYYVMYDGIKGFVLADEVHSLHYDSKEKTIELKEEKDFYNLSLLNNYLDENEKIEDFLKRTPKIGKIPKSATVTVYTELEDYEHVEHNSRFIVTELVKYKGKLGCIVTIKEDENIDEEVQTPEPSIEPTITPNNKKIDNSKKTDNMLLYCIIGGVLLTITALGIIIVINKKNKKDKTEKNVQDNKQDINKEENKEIKKALEDNIQEKRDSNDKNKE